MSLKYIIPILLLFSLSAEEISTNEKCTVRFYCDKEIDDKGKGEYSFTISNHQDRMVPFLFSHIQVKDQEGREVRVMKRKELIARVEADTHAKLLDLYYRDPENEERIAEILRERDSNVAYLEKTMFESAAIEPNGEYSAHFAVKVSDRMINELEELEFTFLFDAESLRFNSECP